MDEPLSDRIHREVTDFLFLEAEMLDNGRFRDWLALLTEDITYRMPVRVTRGRGDGDEFVNGMDHFDEDVHTLQMRVKRLETNSAWAEDPPSRTRHFVSNVRVRAGVGTDDFEVRSNLLLYRNRGDIPAHDLLSAERHDLLRRTDRGWRLASRKILLDQSTVGTLNLAVLL